MRLKFEIESPGEPDAGIRAYTDIVIVEVESGDPGGDDGEFMKHMQLALSEWFGDTGAGVGAEDVTEKLIPGYLVPCGYLVEAKKGAIHSYFPRVESARLRKHELWCLGMDATVAPLFKKYEEG